MHISGVRIRNYKSFDDSGTIELGREFTVVVGKNDSGKSSLIEALSTRASSIPHRSLKSLPTVDTPLANESVVEFKFQLEQGDAAEILRRVKEFHVRCPAGNPTEYCSRVLALVQGPFSIEAALLNGGIKDAWFAELGRQNLHGAMIAENSGYPGAANFVIAGGGARGADVVSLLVENCRQRIYAFRAERMGIGEAQASGASELLPDARNLADVLNRLIAANRTLFDRLLAHVSTIFPHITEITVPVMHGQGGLARILLWSTEVDLAREDLAVPLNASGTGIGQVLALLYVVVTAATPRIILIDEPQSFLHPGAFRKLLEILRDHKQHQYIIATHSPTGLGTERSDFVLVTRRDGSETRVDAVDRSNQVALQTFLLEVGARLSDVFGADRILWVEGKTEEVCFPELLRRVAAVKLEGVQVLGVISTDELGAKHGERAFDIYSALSRGPSVMPKALNFVFDREGRTERQRQDLDRKSRGLVRWLPRRMYENYLIEPDAISAVIAKLSPETATTAAEVEKWLSEHGCDSAYLDGSWPQGSSEWCNEVHGAKLLRDLFSALSESKLSYDKVIHGLMLTEHLIDQPSQGLRELATWLAGLISSNVGEGAPA